MRKIKPSWSLMKPFAMQLPPQKNKMFLKLHILHLFHHLENCLSEINKNIVELPVHFFHFIDYSLTLLKKIVCFLQALYGSSAHL